jgi:hypothetical protein
MRAHLLLAFACAACGPRNDRPNVKEWSTDGLGWLPCVVEESCGGPVVYGVDEIGLMELAGTSGAPVAVGPIPWCAVDTKARAVWFVNKTGLVVFDQDDRKLYPIVLGDLANVDVRLTYGNQVLGEPTDNVGIVVDIAEPPRLRVEVVCNDPSLEPCQGEVERARELTLADAAYVAALAARGGGSQLVAAPHPTPSQAPRACL